LVDCTIEVSSELVSIDVWPGVRERCELGFRDEASTLCPNRTQLSYGHAVPRDDEGLPGGDGFDDPGIVVAQLALGDAPCHNRIVA
jgi:hypothetical protein